MPADRIFVCYATSGDERGAAIAEQFIDDLQANGANVVTGDENIAEENFVQYLNQELPRCQYVILVQTPHALKSLRVQTTISMALNLVTQQRMKGVLRIVATPVDNEDEQPLWVTPRAFDASQDYPRARDKVLLELGLLSIDDEMPELGDQLTPLSIASSTIILPTDGSLSALSPDTNLHSKEEFSTSERRAACPCPGSLSDGSQGSRDKPLPLRVPSLFANWYDKQPTTPNRRVPALLDRPAIISPWHRSPRLWISIVSAILILVIVLAIGVAATQAKKGGTNVPNHTVSSVSTPHIPTRVPTTTPITAAATATPTATPTVTIAGQATPTPVPTPIHQTIVDDLNNWSKTYSHTANLSFDTNNSQWMHGDTSLLYRVANTPEEVVWKLPEMTSFQAITYFWPSQSASPLSNLSVYTSADDVHWTAATPTLSGGTGNWIEYTYTLSHLSNVNFVQMRWSVTTNNDWAQQIGQVTLKS